jgi:hypothetical protein
MGKESIVAYFKELFRHFPGGSKENHEDDQSTGLRAEA